MSPADPPSRRTDGPADPTAASVDPTGPTEAYRRAAERHGTDLAAVRSEIQRVEKARLVLFLVGVVMVLASGVLPIGRAWSLVLGGIALGVYVVLAFRHRGLRRVERRSAAAETLARLGSARLERRWQEVAELHTEVGYRDPLLLPAAAREESHPYVADLDVFGPASLRALLGPTPTPTGTATLRGWLRGPADVDEIRRRQSAVTALAPDFDGREALAVEALLLEEADERAWNAFLGWLGVPALFGPNAALPAWSVHVARILPPITLTLLVLWSVGAVAGWWIWGVPLAVQAGLAWRWGGALNGYFSHGSGSAKGLRRYHPLLRAWEGYRSGGPVGDERAAEEPTRGEPLVSALQARLHGDGEATASAEVQRLDGWLNMADSRASMLYPALAAGLLSDVHLAHGLERWRASAGRHVRDWFEALGELEALSALATLAHDHPQWSFPTVDPGIAAFEAEGLGHPLIQGRALRTSDVALDPPGRFLLVTGSNMSGKSTLLRSIGLAAVMAQAGSVVCAKRLRMTPLTPFTSMRIHDSLTEGVSLFMAELQRLKVLVDAADRASADGRALLYLIDEVLQGTNSEERRVAARRIVAHLLDSNAIGAVTTHDLALHEEDRLDEAATKVHFRETVAEGEGKPVLSFDYLLRPGLATSRNALKLLEIVGLGDGSADRERED